MEPFAGPAEDRFAGDGLEAGQGRATAPGCLARFACHTRERIPAGDHVLFLGTVAQFDHADGAPLVFFASRYGLPAAELARAADARPCAARGSRARARRCRAR